MPEGPDVCIMSQYLSTKLVGLNIVNTEILNKSKELKGINNIKFPLKIMEINSKGKFLWFELEHDNTKYYLMCTFGLTGVFIEALSEVQKYAKIMVVCENPRTQEQIKIFYCDKLNFGTIELTSDIKLLHKKINKLAPDALKTRFTDGELKNLIKKYADAHPTKNVIKALMEDQTAIVSGIGNYLICEILYDAKISPFATMELLNDLQMMKLAHSIRKITKHAYYNNSQGYMIYFSDFINMHKKGIDNFEFPNYHDDIKIKKQFKLKVYKQTHDSHGNEVKKDSVVKGRTIYWVPLIQQSLK